MKTYELKTKQICYFTFLVEAESEQEALDTLDDGYAIDEELGPVDLNIIKTEVTDEAVIEIKRSNTNG